MKENPVFLKMEKNLGDVERVGIFYDLGCIQRQKFVTEGTWLVCCTGKYSTVSGYILRRQIST